MPDIVQMSARLQELQTNAAIINNKREEEARRASKALSSLSDDDIAMLTPIAPELAVVAKYSAEVILENKHGEIAAIKEVVRKLTTYLDSRLTYYEDQL